MTTEQLVAVLGAITALVIAVGAVMQQLLALRKQIDGRMGEMLELTRLAATREGELQGRDHTLKAAADWSEQNKGSGVTQLPK